jgi:transposase
MNNVAALQKENELLREKLAQAEAKNTALHEQIHLLLLRKFNPSSEKVSPDQLGLFNEAEESADDTGPEAGIKTTPV